MSGRRGVRRGTVGGRVWGTVGRGGGGQWARRRPQHARHAGALGGKCAGLARREARLVPPPPPPLPTVAPTHVPTVLSLSLPPPLRGALGCGHRSETGPVVRSLPAAAAAVAAAAGHRCFTVNTESRLASASWREETVAAEVERLPRGWLVVRVRRAVEPQPARSRKALPLLAHLCRLPQRRRSQSCSAPAHGARTERAAGAARPRPRGGAAGEASQVDVGES